VSLVGNAIISWGKKAFVKTSLDADERRELNWTTRVRQQKEGVGGSS